MEKLYDVFISHSKEDSKLSVALCHYLEQNGLRCWIAPRDVTAGKDYAGCIIEAIQASRIMIVVFSEFSNKSHHVRNEVERAFNHNLAILPFRINNIIPAQSLEYFLGATHWLDALDGNAENYFEVLVRNCLLLIKGEVPLPPTPTPVPGPVPGPVPDPNPVPVPGTGQVTIFRDIFSGKGRIRRTEYGISFIISIVLLFILLMLLGFKVGKNAHAHPPLTDTICYLIILAINSWFIVAQGAKRSHDTGKSGWYSIIPFYQFVLIFDEGDKGTNKYGLSPKVPLINPPKRSNAYLFALTIIALLIVIIFSTPHYDGSGSGIFSSDDDAAILFKNNTNTPIYININNIKDTIRVDSTFKLTGPKGGKATGRAETYWVDGEGHLVGKLLHWDIDTTFNATGSYYYNLNITKFFLLKVINDSDTPTNSISVMYNYDYSNNQNVSISVPNDGKVYQIGYFDINNYMTIRVVGQNGYQKDFSADASTFGDDRNRWVSVTFK